VTNTKGLIAPCAAAVGLSSLIMEMYTYTDLELISEQKISQRKEKIPSTQGFGKDRHTVMIYRTNFPLVYSSTIVIDT